MEMVIQLIEKYGMEVVVLALVINVTTTIVKIPIKLIAQKLNNPSGLTRFIVFLPPLIGFGAVAIVDYYINKNVIFDSAFITVWIQASSLSLAIYAILEKMFMGKNYNNITILESKKAIDNIKTVLTDMGKLQNKNTIDVVEIASAEQQSNANDEIKCNAQAKPLKIILGGRKNQVGESENENQIKN